MKRIRQTFGENSESPGSSVILLSNTSIGFANSYHKNSPDNVVRAENIIIKQT